MLMFYSYFNKSLEFFQCPVFVCSSLRLFFLLVLTLPSVLEVGGRIIFMGSCFYLQVKETKKMQNINVTLSELTNGVPLFIEVTFSASIFISHAIVGTSVAA